MKRTLFISVLLIISFQAIRGQNLFPELRGYKISDDYPVYTPDDLWNYINGAADAYLQLGFIDLNIREYVKGKNIIKAEIYRFGDDARAFGMYSMERSPGYKFINTGVQGYNEEGVVHFYKDCFYVKIMSHSLSAKVNSSMLDLATLISSRMGGSGEFPALLRLFPSEGLLENQETYLLESVLGHEFLRGAFRASYEVEGDRFDIYLFSREDPAEVAAMAASLAGDAWAADDEVFRYAFKDGFNGLLYMARQGGKLILISGLPLERSSLAERYITLMLGSH